MKRLIFSLLLLLGICLLWTKPTQAQTCATSQSLGWHTCASSANIVAVPVVGGANAICVGATPGSSTGGYTCLNGTDTGIYAWGGAVVRTGASPNQLVVFGGGHTNYGGNEIYSIPFPTDGSQPTAVRLTLNTNNPTNCFGGTAPNNFSLPSCDGNMTPDSRHTYDQLAYMPNYDAMFIYSGANAPLGTGAAHDAWMYHFSNWGPSNANSPGWEYLSPISTCPRCGSSGFQEPGNGDNMSVMFNSDDGRVYVWDGQGGIWSYDYSHHAWDSLVGQYEGGQPFGCGSNTFGVYDKSRKRLWVSIAACGMMYLDISSYMSTGNLTGNAVIANSNGGPGGNYGGIVYDPTSTNLIMWNGGSTVVVYNPTTNAFSNDSNSGTGTPPDAGNVNGNPFSRWNYVPSIDAFVLDNFKADFSSDAVFVYRTRTNIVDTQAPTAPTNVTAAAISSSQINITWTASTDNVGVTGYTVESCSGVGCSNFVQLFAQNSCCLATNGNLISSTSYSYRMRAFDGAGNLSSYSSTATTSTPAPDMIPPSAPSSLTATAVSSSQINLAWTASTDNVAVTSYFVERCAVAACSNFVQVASPTSNSYNDVALSGSTLYRYRTRATDAAGNLSGYSNIASDTTQAAPATTTLVDFGSSGTDTYGLTGWSTTIHDVYTADVATGPGGMTIINGNTGQYNFQGVTTATNPHTFSIGDTITVTWYNNTGGSITFTPQISFTGSGRITSGGVWYNMSSPTIVNASSGTSSYTFDSNSTGVYSIVNTGVNFNNTGTVIADKIVLAPAGGGSDVIPPTTPTNLTATPNGVNEIDLSWTASTDNVAVTNYLVYQCLGVGCSVFSQVGTTAGTIFVNGSLNQNTSYSYQVRAIDAAGNISAASLTATAMTGSSDVTAPTAPGALTVTITSYRQATLGPWVASTDPDNTTFTYLIERCEGVGCSNFVQVGTTTNVLSFTEFSLAKNMSHSWRVRASDGVNLSPYSNVVTGTTPNAATLQVGNDKQFTNFITAYSTAVNGDHIEVDYNFSMTTVSLTIAKCITISGVGPPGTYGSFLWDGGAYDNSTGGNPLPNNKGILVISPAAGICVGASAIVLNDIELAGAYGDVNNTNAAGIRYDPVCDLTITNSYIHDNQEGLLSGGSGPYTITVKNTIIARNGDESSQTHNFYIGFLAHLLITGNKIMNARGGHDIKSRALLNEIYSNFISSKDANYDDGIEIDLPDGGDNYIIGNIIEQGTNTSNSSVVAVAEETCSGCQGWNPTNRLYVINNTFANYRTTGNFLQVTSTGNNPPTFIFVNQNNIFYNGGNLYNISTPTLASNNTTTAVVGDFVNGDGGNYRLVLGASEIGAGTNPGTANGISLIPTTIYLDPAMTDVRPVENPLSIGAYAFNGAPTPGNGGVFSATTNITQSSLTLNWTKATDAVSPQNTLQYTVYKSTTNNIITVANMLANGTLISGPTTDINTGNVSALPCGTTLFFNVLVQNQAGTQAAYNGTNAITLGCLNHAGRGRYKK